MDAIKFLITEHDRFRKSFEQISESDNDVERKKQFNALTRDLIRHEKMEHTVWYPYLKKNAQLNSVIKHLLAEERKAERMITKLKKTPNPTWEEKFEAFKADVSHHASEEETELFPEVEKVLDKKELEDLGKEMLAFKGAPARNAVKGELR